MASVQDQKGIEPTGRTGTGWLMVGLQRGVALSVLYGSLWIAVAWIANRVRGPETDVVTLGLVLALFGLPIGALAGTLLAAVCAVVDRRKEGRLTRRTVAVRVIGTVAVVTALLAAAGLDYWAVYVGGPCALGLASLWIWPLPDRRPPMTAVSEAGRRRC
ncbi:MAG: hypothetical protein R2714_16260 [Microthrixaceae bacterium]